MSDVDLQLEALAVRRLVRLAQTAGIRSLDMRFGGSGNRWRYDLVEDISVIVLRAGNG